VEDLKQDLETLRTISGTWVRVDAPTDMILLKLPGVSLDGGEAEAIALAVERKR